VIDTPALRSSHAIHGDPDVAPSLATVERIVGALPHDACTLEVSVIHPRRTARAEPSFRSSFDNVGDASKVGRPGGLHIGKTVDLRYLSVPLVRPADPRGTGSH
jgi:hypothetical protein